MGNEVVFEDHGGLALVEKLLEERRRELRRLDDGESQIPSATEYQSCRHSLLQAIKELESLLSGTGAMPVVAASSRVPQGKAARRMKARKWHV